jgi:HlyD family secretion protein
LKKINNSEMENTVFSKKRTESDIAKVLEMDTASNNKKLRKRWMKIAWAALVVVVVIVAWRMSGKSAAVQYKTAQVQQGNMTVLVTATGTLQPTNQVTVGCEISGTVKSVAVDYNDKVAVNQVLAKLDPSKLQAQVTQSRATLESQKAKVLQARATVAETNSKLTQLKKVWELSNKKVPSQTDLDAAEAAYERAKADEASARAAVTQAQATLDAYMSDFSKMVVRSPINGIVLSRNIEPGQTVAASFTSPTLFTLAEDLTEMELHVNVDEADVGKVQVGQKATFTVAAYPNRKFEATISQTRYASSTTSGVVTYETVLKVDNKDLALRPGMTATAEIVVQDIGNAVLIPTAALRFTPPSTVKQPGESKGLMNSLMPHPPSQKNHGGDNTAGKEKTVWTLVNGQLTSIAVTVGATNGDMTELTGGDVKPGMELITDAISQEK